MLLYSMGYVPGSLLTLLDPGKPCYYTLWDMYRGVFDTVRSRLAMLLYSTGYVPESFLTLLDRGKPCYYTLRDVYRRVF